MTLETTITADCEGRTLEALGQLIAAREKYMAETTSQAVVATAINILKGCRAATNIVDVDSAVSNGYVVTNSDTVAGFKSPKGSNKGYRVIRAAGGHEMTSVNKVNLAGKWSRGEVVSVFVVLFKYHDFSVQNGMAVDSGEKYSRFYVIARSAEMVEEWAKNKLATYIKRYRGMAKKALGHAMSDLSAAEWGGGFDGVSAVGDHVARANITVRKAMEGFSSGNCSVEVYDSLNYADLALKSNFDEICKRTANKTSAIIKLYSKARLGEEKDLGVPFPEVAGRR